MARHLFNANVSAASQRSQFPVFSDQALTTPVTDLLDENGTTAVTVVTRDRDFYGPDGVTVLWGNPSNDSSAAPVKFVATDINTSGEGGLPAGGSAGDVLTKNTGADGDAAWATPSGGSVPAGTPVVRAFPFDHTAASLVTGHNLYTPTVGDVLIDAWIEVTAAWDGTTPTADIEQWALAATTNGGLFNGASNGAGGVDLTVPDGTDLADPTSLLIGEALSGVRMTEALGNATLALAVSGAALTLANMGNGFRYLPARFQSASPLGVVVNQTGKKGGTTSAATTGSAVLYLVTATPATP